MLKEYRNRWFLFGSRADDMKIFNLALDRIVDIQPCEGETYRDNPEFGEDYFDDVVGVTKHERLTKETVRIWADNKQASYILTKPMHASQRVVEKCRRDGSMIFEIDVVVNYELEALLMGFGAGVKVLAPQSLVVTMHGHYLAGTALYSTGR